MTYQVTLEWSLPTTEATREDWMVGGQLVPRRNRMAHLDLVVGRYLSGCRCACPNNLGVTRLRLCERAARRESRPWVAWTRRVGRRTPAGASCRQPGGGSGQA